MTAFPGRLVLRNLSKHPIRSLLTVGSMVVAVFLLCTLRSLVTTLNQGVESAKSDRLIVQSAVSLFVNLPISYEPKIAQVEGVRNLIKWNWFGGYYQDPGNFFGQFSVDADRLFETYPEIEIIDGSGEDFVAKRTACIVGVDLAEQFDFEVGQRIPIIGALYPRGDGLAWEFECAGIYRATSTNVDERTLFFHHEYLEEALDAGAATGPDGISVYSVLIEPGADQLAVMAGIDALFENGPQRVQTTTEAEFQAQFVSMIGNVPMFVSYIGGGVLLAILLAVVNTMLMAAREQTHDVGVLKALGFEDRTVSMLMLAQSLSLCLIGGVLGLALAVGIQPVLADVLGTAFPGYNIRPETLGLGLGVAVAIGLVAGIVPALRAGRQLAVNALRGIA